MRLILMRHAKSDWSTGQPDHARPLNQRGKRSAQALGEWLRTRGDLPDLALVSDAQRTRDTFAGLGFDCKAEFLPALYHAGPQAILHHIAQASARCLLLVGHNPGIAEAAARLASPDHARFEDYPTGATLIVDLDEKQNARLVDFTVPRDLM